MTSIFRRFFRRGDKTSILAMSTHDAWCWAELRRRRLEKKIDDDIKTQAERVNASSQKSVDPTLAEGSDNAPSGGEPSA